MSDITPPVPSPPPTRKWVTRSHHRRTPPSSSSESHSFQPVLVDYLEDFTIPKAIRKHLDREDKDENNESGKKRKKQTNMNVVAKLRTPTGRVWNVTVDESRKHFTKGWEEFARGHDLQIGNFLVFEYLGNLRFKVTVLDRTGAERDYSHLLHGDADEQDKGGDCAATETGKGLLTVKDESGTVGAAYLSSGRPYFRTTMKNYSFRWPGMLIPNDFARQHGLADRWCDMTIIDEKQRPWKMTLRFRKSGKYQVYLSKGWDPFQKANGLKVDDFVVFELIDAGENPVMKFYNVTPAKSACIR